jgi:hypothetical protein
VPAPTISKRQKEIAAKSLHNAASLLFIDTHPFDFSVGLPKDKVGFQTFAPRNNFAPQCRLKYSVCKKDMVGDVG